MTYNKREYKKEWLKNHSDYMKKYHKEYYLKNKDKISKQSHEYYLENKDKILKQIHEYYIKNKQHILKTKQKYNRTEKGKQTLRKNCLIHAKKYPDKMKARHRLHYLFRNKYLYNSEFNCAICGKQPIEKHHETYDLPYVFIPLCKYHHNIATNNEKVI